MFLSFACFGILPVSIFGLGGSEYWQLAEDDLFLIASSISFIVLAILAVIKSSFTASSVCYSIIEAVVMGFLCSSASYVVGLTIKTILL
jgi:VIT1/CCC1 family predicted Fe2+/Mn2+ transporter